jgi:hypothetical protein
VPSVHRSAERIRAAFEAAGATPGEEGIGFLSADLVREAVAAGLVACWVDTKLWRSSTGYLE